MNRNLKTYLNLLWQSVLFWAFAYVLFTTIRFSGHKSIDAIEVNQGDLITFKLALEYSVILGALIGLFYSIIEFLFDTYISKRIKTWIQIAIKTVVYLFVIIVTSTFIRVLFQYQNNVEVDVQRGWWRKDFSFWVGTFYFVIASLIFSFIKIAIEKFGRKNFVKILLGTYKKPKEEKRIFMFLDLKDSTTIAENLGHFKYSEFIQDCFYDLNEIVPKYDAEIYQYVGDEAVLTWEYKKGLANNNCVSLFFKFQNRLKSKAAYYQEKYEVVPEFKAGLHGGELIVAEVGTVKKELAYHGDVINTSARIQAECNKYKVPMLISEKLLKDLNISTQFTSKLLGNVLLKGKHDELKIHTISALK